MLSRKNVLILGAGASVDMGYPTGDGLIKCIRELKNVQPPEWNGMNFGQQYHEFYKRFDLAQTPNIDSFLRHNTNLEREGTELIAYSILSYEEPIKGEMKCFEKLKQASSWLSYLFHHVAVVGCTEPKDVIQSLSNLTIISFNYDLAVEAFFLTQFICREDYAKHTKDLMSALNVIHIYGKLYSLRQDDGSYRLNNYAARVTQKQQLAEHAMWCGRNLHVMGGKKQGDLKEAKDIKSAKACLKDADIITAIGFGFDQENCDLLKDPGFPSGKQIFYTNMEKVLAVDDNAETFFVHRIRPMNQSAYELARNNPSWK